MMLFDKDGAIKRYDSPEAILKDFYDLRLEYYEKRRVALLKVSRGIAGAANAWLPSATV
jgi:DNA topoisomerase-2